MQRISYDNAGASQDSRKTVPAKRERDEDSADSDLEAEFFMDDDDFSESESDEPASLQASTSSSSHKLRHLSEGALEFSHARFRDWEGFVRYVVPPDGRLGSPKRARTYKQQTTQALLEYDGDKSELESFTLRLSCPFFTSDPERYRDCVERHDFKSVYEVIKHLRRCHIQPVYCPMCYQEFPGLVDRDEHISKRTCKFSEEKTVSGINDYKWAKILRRAKPCLGEVARWKLIWTILFPHSEPPNSPYLDSGLGLKVSMVREFWTKYGKACITQFLQSRDLACGQDLDEETQTAVAKLTLDGLIVKMRERSQSPTDCIESQQLELRVKDGCG